MAAERIKLGMREAFLVSGRDLLAHFDDEGARVVADAMMEQDREGSIIGGLVRSEGALDEDAVRRVLIEAFESQQLMLVRVEDAPRLLDPPKTVPLAPEVPEPGLIPGVESFDIFALKWDSATAPRDEIVTMSARTEGLADGTSVRIEVHELPPHATVARRVDAVRAQVRQQQIEARWRARSTTPTESIPTAQQLPEGQPWQGPRFFFTVSARGRVFGEDRQSGLIELRDFLDLVVVDSTDTPLGHHEYSLLLADGSTREGTLDAQGSVHVSDLPPGPTAVELTGLPKP